MYTQDWFSGSKQNFLNHLNHLIGKEGVKILEIGSFEGLSTNWFVDNILTSNNSKIYCIDTFEGSYEHLPMGIDLNNLYERFLNNTKNNKEKIEIYKGKSSDGLRSEKILKEKYDFIYIDGCHESKEVLEDAVLSWPLLKNNGIMIFDDYLWNSYSDDPNMTPKISVDSFLNCYKKYISVLEINHQFIIKKTS